MICQFKSVLIIFCFLLLSAGLNAQDTLILEDKFELDSIQELLREQIIKEAGRISYQFKQELAEQQLKIESLQSRITLQESKIQKLAKENDRLEEKIGKVNQSVSYNKSVIFEERQRFKRILLLAGPSILLLLILSTVLFFLLILKYQEQTEIKINALRKYTSSEIEDTRNTLLKKFKKKIRKLRGGKK